MSNRKSELASKIAKAKEDYYNGNPTMSNAEYDVLEQEYLALGGEILVGAPPLGSIVKLRHPMKSIKSMYGMDKVNKFFKDGVKEPCIEPKYDGIAAEVVVKDNKITAFTTRGDGVNGQCMMANLYTVNIHGLESLGNAVVHGEVVIAKEQLDVLGDYKVARSAVNGILKTKEHNTNFVKVLYFLPYRLFPSTGNQYDDMHSAYRRMGLWPNFVKHESAVIDEVPLLDVEQKLLGTIDCDGIVFKEGTTDTYVDNGTPYSSYCVAYKSNPEPILMKVKGLIGSVSGSGTITPVVLLEPQEYLGKTISKVNATNFKKLERMGIGPGAEVMVTLAGMIVPHIVYVSQSGETHGTKVHRCPSCNSDIAIEGTRVYCTNKVNCPAQLTARIKHLFSRDAMNVQGFGSSVIEALIASGHVGSPDDLFALTEADICSVVSPGKAYSKKSQNLHEALVAIKEIPLDKLLYGLGIKDLGKKEARLLAENFTLEELRKANLETFNKHPVYCNKQLTVTSIIDFLNSDNVYIIDTLLVKNINIIDIKE